MVTTLTVQRMRVMQGKKGKDWTQCAGQVYEANHVMEMERERN